MDFALSDIDTNAAANGGVVVPLKKLDGSPLLNAKKEPVTLTLLGSDSKLYRKLNRALGRQRLERLQKKRAEAASDEMLDLNDKEDIELLAKITVGWSGILDSKHKPVEFTEEGAVELYTKFPVAREQAEGAVLDRTRFIQPS